MDSKQITPSVIARLMGFEKQQQHHQPVPQRQRVLSQNYLNKVASIGLWGKKHSSNQEQDMKDVEITHTLNRDKQQKASPRKTRSTNSASCISFVDTRKGHFGNSLQQPGLFIAKRIIDTHATPPHKRLKGLKSMGSSRVGKSQTCRKHGMGIDWGSSKLNQKLHNGILSPKPKSGKKEITLGCSSSTAVLKDPHSSDRGARRFRVLENESLFIKVIEKKQSVDDTKSILQKDKVSSEIGANSMLNTSKETFLCPGHKGCEMLGTESKKSEISSPSFFDLQDEDYVSSYCFGTYPECAMESEEAYQPSPVSVLEPAFVEDTPEDFQSFPSVDLHGLEQQLEILKSEDYFETFSEGSGMVVSSNEESEDSDVDKKTEESQKEELIRFFGVQEIRDFSYVDNVLTMAGFQNSEWVSVTWHSSDIPIDPIIFEKLEKNYADQTSWKRSERRLLFDRVNSGLLEILKSPVGTPTWKTPASRRLSLILNVAAAKKELWKLLMSQEQKTEKDSSAHMLDKYDYWLESCGEIEPIIRELESKLFDELVAEVVSVE